MEIQSTRVETKLLVGHSAHNTSSLPDSRFLSKGCSSQEQDLLLWKKDLTPGARRLACHPPAVGFVDSGSSQNRERSSIVKSHLFENRERGTRQNI